MSYPGRPPIMQGLPMAYMPMGAPPPQMMPAVMPIQHVSNCFVTINFYITAQNVNGFY